MTIHWTAAALQPDPHDIAPLHGLVPDAIGAGAPAGHFRNPIFAGHAPDPTVGRDPRTGTFYIYVTHNQASPGPDPIGGTYLRVPVLETRDFNVMVPRGDAMPARPAWVSTEPLHECLWAPHVVPPCAPGDQWLLYFSGLDRRSGQHGIGVAVADDPLGPFTPQPEPLVTGPGYTVIDPFTYRAPDGAAWLYWGSHHAPIRAQQLTADGLALTGEVRDVLHPADRYDGHMRLVEAFSLVRRGDTFFARFSGENTHNARYAVMEEPGPSMFGPFAQALDHPVLSSNATFHGPGHHEQFLDDDGVEYMLYHAFIGDDRTQRVLLLDRVDELPGGGSVVNGGRGPSTDPQRLPTIRG